MQCNFFLSDNGGYAQWGDWTGCSVTCGTGQRSRRRYCTNPPPSPGGKDCSGLGPDTLTEQCNSGDCPSKEMTMFLVFIYLQQINARQGILGKPIRLMQRTTLNIP